MPLNDRNLSDVLSVAGLTWILLRIPTLAIQAILLPLLGSLGHHLQATLQLGQRRTDPHCYILTHTVGIVQCKMN